MTDVRMAMDAFFCSVQHKAYRQAELATRNRDEALDIVQDAMMRLAQRYSEQAENWPKLFQRILQNTILDWHRRKKVRSILYWFQSDKKENGNAGDTAESYDESFVADKTSNPFEQLQQNNSHEKVLEAIQCLPPRQQQAFILRAWWEYDTKESAFAMECTEGSVKTHYSRAIARLNELLANIDL